MVDYFGVIYIFDYFSLKLYIRAYHDLGVGSSTPPSPLQLLTSRLFIYLQLPYVGKKGEQLVANCICKVGRSFKETASVKVLVLVPDN